MDLNDNERRVILVALAKLRAGAAMPEAVDAVAAKMADGDESILVTYTANLPGPVEQRAVEDVLVYFDDKRRNGRGEWVLVVRRGAGVEHVGLKRDQFQEAEARQAASIILAEMRAGVR